MLSVNNFDEGSQNLDRAARFAGCRATTVSHSPPHTVWAHPESSCLKRAAFVPAQRQWEPACWQITLLQPPLSNGKNAAASSSVPMGGNLPSHINDNNSDCCSRRKTRSTHTQNRTCWPVSVTGPLSNQILGHTRLSNTSTAAIGELTLNYHDLSPLLSLKQVLKWQNRWCVAVMLLWMESVPLKVLESELLIRRHSSCYPKLKELPRLQ